MVAVDIALEPSSPSREGPYSGNAEFALTLTPPLEEVWSQEIAVGEVDGHCVGGNGNVIVPMRGGDLRCLALDDGRQRWEHRACRGDGERCYLAGPYLFAGKGDGRATAMKTEGSRPRALGLTLAPVGVYRDDRGAVFLQRDAAVRLDDLSIEATTHLVTGRMRHGLVYGMLDMREPGGDRRVGLVCHDPAAARTVWMVRPRPGEDVDEQVVAVADDALVTWASDQVISVRSTANGSVRWDSPTTSRREDARPPVISGSRLLRWESEVLICHRLDDGAILWEMRAAQEHTNLIATNHFLWVGMRQQRQGSSILAAIDPGTGRIAWSRKMQAAPAGQALAVVDDRLVCAMGDRLTCYRATG